jgi:hypothetical protein
VKILTGVDKVEDVSVKVSILASSNYLPILSTDADVAAYVKPDRLRRIVVVPTVTSRDSLDVSEIPCDQDSINHLAYISMIARAIYDTPPLNPIVVLQSLFLSKYKDALKFVNIKLNASRVECICATTILCWNFGIRLEDMSQCMRRVGSRCAIVAGAFYYIAHITPRAGSVLIPPVVTQIVARKSQYSRSYSSFTRGSSHHS